MKIYIYIPFQVYDNFTTTSFLYVPEKYEGIPLTEDYYLYKYKLNAFGVF